MTKILPNSWKRAHYVLALLCLLCTHHLYAQSFVVDGTVKDESGVSLPGVNVLLKGTTTGTVTDADGKYSIEVPSSESTLIFSFIGYVGQEVNVGQQATVNILMVADITTLSEVVVVGFGTQEKVNMTGLSALSGLMRKCPVVPCRMFHRDCQDLFPASPPHKLQVWRVTAMPHS